ncbi:MAG: S8 family serine peptidase [Oscillospiraceae bacterium]|nr:S8 family serine peptidase [Oscillospiraceae bacterium]
MQYFRKALALTAAALLTCGTADRIPLPSCLRGDAAQIQAFMQSLASLSLPEEPFETLRFDRAEQQLYCDGTAVGQSYGGYTVRDGELIAEDTGLAPDSAAACAGMEYTEDADGVTVRAPFASGRLILRCEGDPPHTAHAETVAEMQGLHVLQYDSPADAYAAYRRYQEDSRVLQVQPDQIYHADMQCCAIPADSKDPAVGIIGADQFYAQYLAEKESLPEITVAVLDTGLYEAHDWFQGRIAAGGITMVTNDSDDYSDAYGHGTHCAGIIAQTAPENVKILPVKVLSDRGYGYDTGIYCGMLYAMEQGARIVSMSLGGNGESWLLDEGIAALSAADISCIAAAGNEHEDAIYHHPARNPECVTVSAVAVDTTSPEPDSISLAAFSNYGEGIDFCAPGALISSAYLGSHDTIGMLSGTSMSTPFVAAAYAMLLSCDPSLTRQQLYDAVKANVTDLGSEGFDSSFGWGMISLADFQFPEQNAPKAAGTDMNGTARHAAISPDAAGAAPQGYIAANIDTNGTRCRIAADVPFVHNAQEYFFTLTQDTRLSLRTQNGEPVSGKIEGLLDLRECSISDREPAELEVGSYLLTLEQPASGNPAAQQILTLHTDAVSVYMADVEAVDAFYTGSPVTPHAQVRLGDTLLHEGIDYTVIAEEPLSDIGRYRLRIQGTGRYYDTRSFTFRILPPEQSAAPLLTEGSHEAEIGVPGEACIYRWIPAHERYIFSRTDNRPGSIRILDQDGNLTASLTGCFELHMTADVIPNAEYYVLVSAESPTLTGKFPFSLTADFRLLENCTVRMASRLAAESGIPEYEIYDGDTKLTEGTDYEVFAVGGEAQSGIAEIIFRGTGIYRGMLDYDYAICPPTPEALPEDMPPTVTLTADLPVTAARCYPGTLRLFRFAAPSDGRYKCILPMPQDSGACGFIYNAEGRLMPENQTEFDLREDEVLQILCVTMTLATEFDANEIYEIAVVPLQNAQVWETDGIRFRLLNDGTALVTDAMHDACGGIRIPDTVTVPQSGETISVSGIDAALRAKIAETHTIYGAPDGRIAAYCETYGLCFAADTLTNPVSGDLTGDGRLNPDDLRTLNRILCECSGMLLDDTVMQAADVNQDGILDMQDAAALCRLIG